MLVSVRAHPRARREHAEWRDAVLHVWVTMPALEGRANRALVRAIAAEFGVAPSRVRLVSGERGRDKVVEVEGVDRLPEGDA